MDHRTARTGGCVIPHAVRWPPGASPSRAGHTIEDLLRRHEELPLIPEPSGASGGPQQVLPTVGADEQFESALSVYDLAVKAGSWGSEVEPTVNGWARVARRPLESDMFVASVVGHSMEPGIPDGAWGLFPSFPVEGQLPPTALDGRRVVVRLASNSDPETGRYTLKRRRVTKGGRGRRDPGGHTSPGQQGPRADRAHHRGR